MANTYTTHAYAKRIGAPGVDHWKCQNPACGAEGTLKELYNIPCKGQPPTRDQIEANLLDAIEKDGKP